MKLSLPSWHLQAKGLHSDFIQLSFCLSVSDHAEAAGVVPHGPANVVAFQRRAHVGDPPGAILRIGKCPVDTEFVADERNSVLLAPIGGLTDFRVDARGVP